MRKRYDYVVCNRFTSGQLVFELPFPNGGRLTKVVVVRKDPKCGGFEFRARLLQSKAAIGDDPGDDLYLMQPAKISKSGRVMWFFTMPGMLFYDFLGPDNGLGLMFLQVDILNQSNPEPVYGVIGVAVGGEYEE